MRRLEGVPAAELLRPWWGAGGRCPLLRASLSLFLLASLVCEAERPRELRSIGLEEPSELAQRSAWNELLPSSATLASASDAPSAAEAQARELKPTAAAATALGDARAPALTLRGADGSVLCRERG
eukprot:TRINITY_DN34261_c0_g1_i1.p2 TRINITY_DN34261_c0_g1~~TRINITY_DN34261_c0_g1_i1.p2  ORF type:complete len:126 (+),score=25.55 TRINITY_DN34261_c0_g1_i1:134-511(+)